MTTLPQTRPSRLPRPAASQQLAMPRHGGPPGPPLGPSNAGGGSQMTAADVWRVIRANLWLIIVMVILSGGAGYGVNYYLAENHPRFTARALLRAGIPVPFNPLQAEDPRRDNRSIALEQRTQAQLLRSEVLISDVLQRADNPIRQTTWFTSFVNPEDAKKHLLRNLTVRPVPDTELIEVTMSYSNPRDTAIIIQEIGNEHIRQQREISRSRHTERNRQLSNLLTTYRNRQREVQAEIRNMVLDLSIEGGVPGNLNTAELEMRELLRSQFHLQLNTTSAQGRLRTMEQQIQQGIDPPHIEHMADQNRMFLTFKQRVADMQSEIDTEVIRIGDEHPHVQRLRNRQEAFRRQMEVAREEALVRARTMMLEDLRSQVGAAEEQLEAINERVAVARQELGELTNRMANYLARKDEEKVLTELIRQVEHERDMVTYRSQHDQGGISWAVRPLTPDNRSFPRLPVSLAVAVMLGLALSLGIAFLREMMDTSVRSPQDVARVGQMNLLAMLPHESDDPHAGSAKLPLVVFESPHSVMADQFRQMRTRLLHTAALDVTRTIAVSGPGPRVGKTTVACNLAAGLALNGRRILLVDADFRRPELHKVFDVPNDHGLGDVLQALDEFDSAVQETQVPNLSVLTGGAKLSNPTELLESHAFIDFIERALEEYDHVVFDSGPVLFVSESVALAPRVDGVISVIRAHSNSRGLVQRMRDALRQIKAEHLGVVLNAVRSQGGGYYGRNIKAYYAYQNGIE